MEKLEDSPYPEGLSWLLEMELVATPYVLNSIILNLFGSIKGIKDAEFVIDEQQKKILIFLQLSWFAQKFKARVIESQVLEMLDQVLPSFKKRVVFERETLAKALKILEKREQAK